MSERGSFVTEYINCDKCFQEAKKVLLFRNKSICSTVIPSWVPGEEEMPIIAGKVGGIGNDSYPGGEFVIFEEELTPILAAVICHPLRIAVLAESGGSKFLIVRPKTSA